MRRKFCTWKTKTGTLCCGQWLAALESQADTFSVATVPDRNRSSISAVRAFPDGSPTLYSSQLVRHQAVSPQLHVTLVHSPFEENTKSSLQCRDQDDSGQSSAAMLVSFLIHLKDPVELLPHVVNTNSDWDVVHCSSANDALNLYILMPM